MTLYNSLMSMQSLGMQVSSIVPKEVLQRFCVECYHKGIQSEPINFSNLELALTPAASLAEPSSSPRCISLDICAEQGGQTEMFELR